MRLCAVGQCSLETPGVNFRLPFFVKLYYMCISPFQNKPWFSRVCSTSALKTLWEKEKLLVTSNFSFSHSVFYRFWELSAIFINFEIIVYKLFQFGRVWNLSFRKALIKCSHADLNKYPCISNMQNSEYYCKYSHFNSSRKNMICTMDACAVINPITRRQILDEQFLLFPHCFQKACFPGASKGVIVWEWVNMCGYSNFFIS